MKGNNEDLINPDYQRLKEQLILINNSFKVFRAHWIYLIKKDDDNWIFSVDPIDGSSPDYAPPGTIYKNYPKELDTVLTKKETIVVGPYKDQWGDFISAFSPIRDLENGEVLGVLGADIDAAAWRLNAWRAQIFPAVISLFSLMLWILFFLYFNKKIKNEKSLQAKERHFRSIAETISDIIYRLDLKGRVIYVSPSIEKVLGFSTKEALGKNFIDFIAPQDRSKAANVFKKLLQGENVDSIEMMVNRKDGKTIQADLNIASIQEEGVVSEIQGVIHDISQTKESLKEVKKQNEELKRSHEAFLNILEDMEEEKEKLAREKDKIQAILQSIGDGVFVVDSQFKIILFNQVAAELSGYTIEEAIGARYEKILQFVFENDGKTNNVFIKEAISSGQIKEMSIIPF